MHWLRILPLNITKILFTKVNQHLVLDLASSDNNHVLAEVISRMEVNNHVASDAVDIINVTQDRLAHHVLSVNVVVDIFH